MNIFKRCRASHFENGISPWQNPIKIHDKHLLLNGYHNAKTNLATQSTDRCLYLKTWIQFRFEKLTGENCECFKQQQQQQQKKLLFIIFEIVTKKQKKQSGLLKN